MSPEPKGYESGYDPEFENLPSQNEIRALLKNRQFIIQLQDEIDKIPRGNRNSHLKLAAKVAIDVMDIPLEKQERFKKLVIAVIGLEILAGKVKFKKK